MAIFCRAYQEIRKIYVRVLFDMPSVLQHAGYTREGLTAVMVFQARKLPHKDVSLIPLVLV